MCGGDEMRFSDPMLIRFHNEFKRLQASFDEHAEEEKECMRQMMFTQVENTAAILNTNNMIVAMQKTHEEQMKDTKELIQLFRDGQTVIRLGAKLGTFSKWLLSLGALCAALKWLAEYNPMGVVEAVPLAAALKWLSDINPLS